MHASLERPRLQILVVDDEPSIVQVVGLYLENKGCVITPAENGTEGLRLFEQQPFDLVISDRVMPEMTGDQLAAEIRARAPEMPIILITGHKGPQVDITRFNAFLPKPFTKTQLLATLEDVLPALFADTKNTATADQCR